MLRYTYLLHCVLVTVHCIPKFYMDGISLICGLTFDSDGHSNLGKR